MFKVGLALKLMIELFAADTPNGKKISIMLEEIGYEYKVTKVDLNNGDQFKLANYRFFGTAFFFRKIYIAMDL